MSKKTMMVELIPPKGSSERISRELLTSRGHVCGYCNGTGLFKNGWCHRDAGPCPVCGGTGEVDAVVTIEWKPGKHHEP